ncbi:MAG: VCBS repeat-containing protein [Cytophagaceae bacterium]|nr:VCBS repeat-containing protein [Cytophagaceae bacterium]
MMSCGSSSLSEKQTTAAPIKPPLFTLMSAEQTQVDFSNTLSEGLNTNILMYEYFYNGGGVAVGDVDGDGREDLYFSGNMVPNRLYLNRGNLRFEDVTTAAGVAGREGPWKTGVTMADVNGDGRLDVYVCYSGNLPPEKRTNQLFINDGPDAQGVPHFSEQARQYGLDSPATSTQGVFFDYDRDDDLDLFLLNHSPKSLPVLDEASTAQLLRQPDPVAGTRLFRNDGNVFRDVTDGSGLSSSALSYGLGAGVTDVNADGWPDVYVSNDYTVPDYLYVNNQNGSFTNQIQQRVGHTSQFSMGNDVADINNDARPDVFTLDMLPEDNRRQKLLFAPDNYEKFNLTLRTGFYHQYMRNMLQLNNGDGTFSEIGQLAGISNTDWSWAPLFADYDNDGWKDLFVTNGYTRDYTNLDFLKYMSDFTQNSQSGLQRQNILELVYKMPSSAVVSYAFKNNGNLTFSNVSRAWGLTLPSNSNGAAYADLDQDGDLDLVVNNVNATAFIYRNDTDQLTKNQYLRVKLAGSGKNTAGIGAKVTLYQNGTLQYLEQMPTRGFQSSVSPVLHFGLGKAKKIDSLRVVWLTGKQQVLNNVAANQVLLLKEQEAKTTYRPAKPAPAVFREVTSPIAYRSAVTTTNDFKRQPLLVNPQSFAGPCLTKADVNGDGREDVFVGGGAGQAAGLFLQQANGQFTRSAQPAFETDAACQNTDAVFFDANGDGNPDLYVCSGGYGDFLPDDVRLQDRLYLNEKGKFTKSLNALPQMRTSTSCVRVADVNGDARPDLFVGGRVVPGRYPESPRSYLLVNDGSGGILHFSDQTARLAPALQRPGMVTDAAWVDLNGDKRPELVVVGEWMPVLVFGFKNETLTDQTTAFFEKSYRGWWNKLLVEDLNGDGRPDLIVGNHGLNSQCRASDREPAEMVYKDFDDNGSIDPILCLYIQGKSYPYVSRDELLDQISLMRPRFPDYKSYADATLTEVFTPEELQGANRLSANQLATTYFENVLGKFREKPLPLAAQNSPIHALTVLDYDRDGKKDLLLGGNANRARLRFGKADANYGLLLRGDGRGQFSVVPQDQSGFGLRGDVRSILLMGNTLLFGLNEQVIRAYRPLNP